MFNNLENIEYVNMHNIIANEANLSYVFNNCTNLKIFLYETYQSYIKDMAGMFYNCVSLTSISLRKFKTKSNSFIDMSFMFYNCQELESVEFTTTSYFGVKDAKFMFYNCTSLIQIDISKFESNNYNYINMSYLFYNCTSLSTILVNFNNFYISDTIKMFYNCISLYSLSFNPYRIIERINMTKMFYNCINIKRITMTYSYSYYKPNDMSYLFYNCISLKSLILEKFNTNNVRNMNYMLYNCKLLDNFDIQKSYFSNSLVTDMRGIFQNCESIVRLNLSTFYTPKVEIMWEMFKDCKSLQNLNIKYFDTSKVTDMESMFEGCSSLISLNLSHFKTSNVQYMNKMFQNCNNLQSLYFNKISANSLSTMYRMFNNCKKLKYLNIFSLTESGQSIFEIFEGTSNNFEFCVEDEDNIPNIFQLLVKTKINIKRDCGSFCYGSGNERISVPSKKLCCKKFEYKGNCYNKCPSRTKVQNIENKCENFTCDYYYNYQQNGCISYISKGYYMNDTELKTIDKCHKSCKTCIEKANNCLECSNIAPFYYLGNCYGSCKYGYYIEEGIFKCKCFEQNCFNCSRESLNYGLCLSCNEGYYTKFNDTIIINNYISCYKDQKDIILIPLKKYICHAFILVNIALVMVII